MSIPLFIDFPNFTMTSAAKTISWSKKAHKEVNDELFIIRAQQHIDKAIKSINKEIKPLKLSDVYFCPEGDIDKIWRNNIYNCYKNNHKSLSHENNLGKRAKNIKRYIEKNYTVLPKVPEAEADDFMYVVKKHINSFVILSADKDLRQLIDNDVWQYNQLKNIFLTYSSPHSNKGDSSDFIPSPNSEEELIRNRELISLDHIPVQIQRQISNSILSSVSLIDNHDIFPPYPFGLCCINNSLRDEGIYLRKPILKTIINGGFEFLLDISRENLLNLEIILRENIRLGYSTLRIGSDLIPHASNISLEQLGDSYENIFDKLMKLLEPILIHIGDIAKKHNTRLTFHPGQYNVISTPHENVFENTIRDLNYHATILDLMQTPRDSVMVVHGGGVYGDKKSAINRWTENFFKLPEKVKRRLVLENCEKCYSVYDCLEISKNCGVPVVFDLHHHEVYGYNFDDISFIPEVLETWRKKYIKPKFHVSSQAKDAKPGAHSDYIEKLSQWLIDLTLTKQGLDIMVEAKAKEKAIQALIEEYML